MITISNLAMQFGGSVLFKQVDLQFTPGSCYGIIGANGAGKSTFLKLLSGELEPTSGEIFIKPGARMSVLKQDQNQYDAYTILDTVIMGNQHLYDVMKEKDALYEKPDFSEEDGMRASELEAEFADMDGWEAESDASKLLQGLGIPVELHYDLMANTDPRLKVKVLLAQALFGKPDIVMLDEPTNNLDIEAINWLEDFILDYEDTGLVIVVSHDRHFLNTVCTHIVDIDYGKIKMYVGNYDFWYESSQLIQQLIRNKNKRAEEKIAELQTFIARFAANKAKSKQATSRRRLLDKMTVEEMPASSRRYPFVGFEREREVGKDILFVTDVSKTIDGVKLLDKVSFIVNKNDKIAFVGENELAQTTLFKILMGELEPDEGSVKWGQTWRPFRLSTRACALSPATFSLPRTTTNSCRPPATVSSSSSQTAPSLIASAPTTTTSRGSWRRKYIKKRLLWTFRIRISTAKPLTAGLTRAGSGAGPSPTRNMKKQRPERGVSS